MYKWPAAFLPFPHLPPSTRQVPARAPPFANKLQPGIDHFLARLRSIVPLVPGGPPYRISIRAEPQLAAEEYRLDVRSTAAAIHSATPRGAFWALQTIVGLLLPGRADIPCVKVC